MAKRTHEVDREAESDRREKSRFAPSDAQDDSQGQPVPDNIEAQRRSHRRRVWGRLSGITAAAFVLLAFFAPLKWTYEAVADRAATAPGEDFQIVAETENFDERELQALPSVEQQRIRDNVRRFRELPPERRRQLQQRWQELSPSERERIREQLRQPASVLHP